MAVELATAYIALVPSLKGASQKISSELGSIDTGSAGSEMGRKMGGGMASSIKSLVGPAIALMGAGMFGGFIKDAAAASDATDKFKATMSFAGMDTSAITAAKDAAKSYADQTVYDLPTIQNMTAQLASNGVKDYTGLTQAAGNLNAVAGGNAETFKSVAMVMTQTAGAGKLTTENWNQMADAIPGAAGPLMSSLKEAGAYTGNFRDAMAAGQITSDEFNAALMKLGNDPVAVEAAKSTKTFEGAIGSLEATINSGLMSALDAMKPALTGAISGLSSGLGAIFAAFGAIFDLFKTGDFTGKIGKALGLDESSVIIGAILGIRNVFSDLWAGLSMGPGVMESIGTPLEGFVAIGQKIRAPFDLAKGAISDFFAGLSMNADTVASIGVPLEGLVAKGAAVRQGLSDLWAGFTLPKLDAAALGGDLTGMVGIGATVRDAFGQIATAVGPLIGNIVQLWSSLSPLQLAFQAIQPFLPQLLDVFLQLAGVVGGSLMTAIMGILPSIQMLQGVFVTLLQGVLVAVLPVIVQLVTMLGATFAQLLPVLIPIITQIATLAATLVTQLAPIFMQLVSAVLPMVVTIFGALLSAIMPLVSMIAGLLIPIIQALMPVVVTVFGVVVNIITAAMQIVMGIIQVVTGIISGNWSQVWDGILNIFSGIWNTILAVVSGVLAIIGSVIVAGLSFVAGFIGSVLGSIGQFFADTWNNVISGVSSMIGQVGGFFSGLWGTITGALSGAGTWLLNAGKNIVQGLIDGIGSMMGSIGNAILSLVPGPIVGVFKAALGIQSPSRVFRALGKHIPEGLNLGIGDGAGDIASTMRNLVTVPDLPVFGAATASAVGAAGIGGRGPVYVQNPFTGEYLLAQVGSVASGIVQSADSNSQYMRRGRG